MCRREQHSTWHASVSLSAGDAAVRGQRASQCAFGLALLEDLVQEVAVLSEAVTRTRPLQRKVRHQQTEGMGLAWLGLAATAANRAVLRQSRAACA